MINSNKSNYFVFSLQDAHALAYRKYTHTNHTHTQTHTNYTHTHTHTHTHKLYTHKLTSTSHPSKPREKETDREMAR